MILSFPDLDTLHLIVSGGLLTAAPTRSGHDDEGAIWVECDSASDESHSILRQLGVAFPEGAEGGEPVAHWPAVLSTVRAPEPTITPQTQVLFELSESAWSGFVGELLRLGNDRLEYRALADGRLLLKAIGPPYYALLQAIDRDCIDSPRAFIERRPGLWIELGHDHPLAAQVQVPGDRLVLVRGTGRWETLAATAFRDIQTALTFAAPTETRIGTAVGFSPIELTPALTGTAASEATLWVVQTDAFAVVDAFVQSADPTLLARLSVAVADGLAVLRLRPSRLPPPEVTLAATAYRPYPRVPNLFVPVGTVLQPPMRSETIRRLFAADGSQIAWLEPDPEVGFKVRSLPDDAFRPSSSWIETVIARHREPILEWVRAAEFAFAGVVMEAEPTTEPATVAKVAKRIRAEPPPKQVAPTAPPTTRRAARTVASMSAAVAPAASREQLHELEQQFLAIDGGLDHPDRQRLWPELARLNAELGNVAEASLCWTHALWDQAEPSESLLHRWHEAEKAAGESPRSRVAAICLAGWSEPAALQRKLAAVHAFLEKHDAQLPARAAWLGWSACAHAVGGDALALARARERMLARLLDRGLDAETDLPSFLRFAGRADSERLRQSRTWIDDIRVRVLAWIETDIANAPAEASATTATTAYTDFFFAFALARLGDRSAARARMDAAVAALSAFDNDTQGAHAFLLQAFVWRIEEVLASRPHAGPLPQEQLEFLGQYRLECEEQSKTHLNELRWRCPYAIDRLREQCRILEPLEKFDPYRHQHFKDNHDVTAAARLPDLTDHSQLAGRIIELLRRTGRSPQIQLFVMQHCVTLVGRMAADQASSLLDRISQLIDALPLNDQPSELDCRLRIVERSLFFAAHFDRNDIVSASIQRLMQFVATESGVRAIEFGGSALGQTVRSLRRLGLRDEALPLLDRLAQALLRRGTLEQAKSRDARGYAGTLQSMLHIAAGWLQFGLVDRAMPILTEARSYLRGVGRPGGDKPVAKAYTQMICNYVTALGQTPPAEARDKIAELFEPGFLDRLPNTFTCRDFYSWLHLNVAEAVVLTVASDDFSLGPIARRWLDEDENLVRKRIHADVRGAVSREVRP